MQALSRNLLKSDQTLEHTKDFTSRIASPREKAKRQTDYIDAVLTLSNTSVFFGKYQLNKMTCRNCGDIRNVPSEKMTDVNIAVELLKDAFLDGYDTAILISADSDLIAPIDAVKKLFPRKRMIVACPPNRFSQSLCKAATAHFQIGRGVIAKSQFPDNVPTNAGYILTRPPSWT